jgi:NAD(P)-dependent dehydrogenase (short-subunit alcohol dehydrogenase family)
MSKRVLITGASRGIGLALAIVFARQEWQVFAGARRPRTPALWNAGHEFPNLHPIPLDVCDDASVAAAFEAVSGAVEALDVLINNAAIFPGEGSERLEELDLAWFGEAFETNVTGVARVCRAALPLLRLGERPRIVNISSGAGSIADKHDHDYYPYSVSKAALNMLSRAMAAEFKPEGIAVTPISPGWVRTEMGGPNAPLSADESAQSLCATIQNLTLRESGAFLGRDGSRSGYAW